jgi:dihydroxyacid dehydratase/phosphogluconate dehydratase
MNVNLSDKEIAERIAAYEVPETRYKRGVFGKYANEVTSASQGAVTS